MLEKIKTYWLFGTQCNSLEFTTMGDRDIVFGVKAKRKKGEFDDIKSFESETIEGLKDTILNGSHGFLCITTSQVLIKETHLQANESDMVREAFPGLNHDDFYHEIFTTSQKAFVAVCRKLYVDEILEQFIQTKIHILGFRLGFGQLHEVMDFIDSQQIRTPRFLITTNNKEISSYDEVENSSIENYQISDVEINSSHLLSLAGLSQYQGGDEYSSNSIETNNALRREFTEKAYFKKGLVLAGALFLGVLTLNAVLFTNYHNKLTRLQEESKIVITQKERFAENQKEIAKKEQIVKNIMLSGNSKSTVYLNRIVSSLPSSISLSLIEYQPLQKNVRPDKPILVQNGKITIEGNSLDKEMFNNWISRLSTISWIENVSTHAYSDQSKSTEFGISLTILDDSEE